MVDVAGTAVGVVSLGITVAHSLLDYYRSWKDAPEDVLCTLASLQSLRQILERIRSYCLLNSGSELNIGDCLTVCEAGVQKLQQKLHKIRKIAPSSCSTVRDSLKSYSLRALYPFKESTLAKLRELVAELKSTLALSFDVASFEGSQTIAAGVDRLESFHRDCERDAILSWLSGSAHACHHEELLRHRAPGTGEWFINSHDFQKWVEYEASILFCPGIPGSGKSFITCAAIDHLQSHFANDDSVGICYIYCKYKRREEQGEAFILSSLLKQLLLNRPLPASLKRLHRECKRWQRSPSLQDHFRILSAIRNEFSRVFIVIDAVDEYSDTTGRGNQLFDIAFEMKKCLSAKLFMTSRYVPQICSRVSQSPHCHIYAKEHDVRAYLASRFKDVDKPVLNDQSLREEITAAILQAVAGMFLLARLHFDSLVHKKTVRAVRETLKTFVHGSEALSRAYDEARARIDNQIPEDRDLARHTVAWILYGQREWTVSELLHALAIIPGETLFDPTNIPSISDVLSVCAGLMVVDEGDKVRFVHYTAQEYFERIRTSWLADGPTLIMRACLTYLTYDVFATGSSTKEVCLESLESRHPLTSYACRQFVKYARVTPPGSRLDLTMRLLRNSCNVSAVTQLIYLCEAENILEVPMYSRTQQETSGIHLAVFCGLINEATELISEGFSPDQKDSRGETPLFWAIFLGARDMVQLFLCQNNVDPNKISDKGCTPLLEAIYRGNEGILRLLLSCAKVNVNLRGTGPHSQTPLHQLTEGGRLSDIEIMMGRNDLKVDSRDEANGRTPLSIAAEKGHEDVMEFLLARGADCDAGDDNGIAPLMHALAGRQISAMRLLLRTGAEPNIRDQQGRTPLLCACERGSEEVVMLLLRYGAGVNCQGHDGRTPLSYAVTGANAEGLAGILIAQGVSLDTQDSSGRTPLSHACTHRENEDVVKLLLDHGADANSSSTDGRSPLSYAAQYAREETVRVLLEAGADVFAKDIRDKSAVWWAQQDEEWLIPGNREVTVSIINDYTSRIGTKKELKIHDPASAFQEFRTNVADERDVGDDEPPKKRQKVLAIRNDTEPHIESITG